MEREGNQNQVSLPSHSPWKSLRDSHIPTAPIIRPFTQNQIQERRPCGGSLRSPPPGSFFNENMLPRMARCSCSAIMSPPNCSGKVSPPKLGGGLESKAVTKNRSDRECGGRASECGRGCRVIGPE